MELPTVDAHTFNAENGAISTPAPSQHEPTTRYIRSQSGKLKLAEIACCLLICMSISFYTDNYHHRYRYTLNNFRYVFILTMFSTICCLFSQSACRNENKKGNYYFKEFIAIFPNLIVSIMFCKSILNINNVNFSLSGFSILLLICCVWDLFIVNKHSKTLNESSCAAVAPLQPPLLQDLSVTGLLPANASREKQPLPQFEETFGPAAPIAPLQPPPPYQVIQIP